MKRYYVSPIIVSQDEDGNTEVKAYAAKFPKTGMVVDIPSDSTTGLPLDTVCIVCITGTPSQHQAILQDSLMDPIVPHNDNFDQEISVDEATRIKFSTKVGITVKDKESVRTIVEKVGKKKNSNFNFERFFISE
jgi:hypothetical protein